MFSINGKPCAVDDYCVIYDYNGADALEFDLSTDDERFADCTEHAVITEDSNRYIVDKVDGSGSRVHVSASLDLRDMYSTLLCGYDNTSDTITNTMGDILPAGWSFVNDAGNTLRRTVSVEYGTPAEALALCAKLYGVTLRYDCINKVVTAYAPESNTLSAAFITEELNLRSLRFYGDSSKLITRLDARGKDGLTFASLNGGKTYVEDHRFTNDIIYGWWKDERYTDKQSLLEAATAKLAELSAPARSYECDVVDLKKLYASLVTDSVLDLISADVLDLISSDGYDLVAANQSPVAGLNYDYQDLSLYKVVSLIDVRRGTQSEYQVVEVKDYPHYPEKNVVTLSSAPPSVKKTLIDGLESEIEEATDGLREDIDGLADDVDDLSDSVSVLEDAVTEATEWITGEGGLGGNVFIRRDNDGKPYEILILDTDSLETAHNVWRWNINGLGFSSTGYAGPYSTAITSDGKFVADFIKAGNLDADRITTGSIYVTKKVGGVTKTLFELDIDSKTLVINTNGFTLDAAGNATFSGDLDAAGGTFSGDLNAAGGIFTGELSAATGSFSGSVNASSGTIGGWSIRSGKLSSTKGGGCELNASDGTITVGGMTLRAGSISGTVVAESLIESNAPICLSGDGDAVYIGGNRGALYTSGTADIGELYLGEPLAISDGGTGATTAAQARANLGISSSDAPHIARGYVAVSIPAGSTEGTGGISYSGFSSAVSVTVSAEHNSNAHISVHTRSVTGSGCSVTVTMETASSSSTTVYVHWQAIE